VPDMINPGDRIIVRSTGKEFVVSIVETGSWSGLNMVRVVDNMVPRWYYESEVKPA
jgi:hypothetical protein